MHLRLRQRIPLLTAHSLECLSKQLSSHTLQLVDIPVWEHSWQEYPSEPAETYENSGIAEPAPTWNTAPSQTLEALRAGSDVRSTASPSTLQSPRQFESPHQHFGQYGPADVVQTAPRSHSAAIPTWAELERQGSFQSPHQFQAPNQHIEQREAHKNLPNPPRSESTGIPSWAELQRQGSYQSPHQARYAEVNEASADFTLQFQPPLHNVEQRENAETGHTMPRPPSAAIPSWAELQRQGSFQSLSSLPPPPIPLSTRPPSRASTTDTSSAPQVLANRMAPPPVPARPTKTNPSPQPMSYHQRELQQQPSTSPVGHDLVHGQQATSYFGQAEGLQRFNTAQTTPAAPVTPPTSNVPRTPQTPGRGPLPSYSTPERTNGTVGFAGNVNTRAITPILARRVTPAPSRPASTQPSTGPVGGLSNQGIDLLPPFQMGGGLPANAAPPFGFETWGGQMMTLNDTRAATPRDVPQMSAADAAYLEIPSPPAQTPLWFGEYGAFVQSCGVEVNPRTPYDNDEVPLFLPGSDSDTSSSSNSGGESLGWDDSTGSEDSEPPLERLKRKREAVLGKRKAVGDVDEETTARKPRLYHHVSFPSPTGGDDEEAEEDMAVDFA
ncbi:hypothetical protein C8R47DRAFT_1066014 [Mycena vitilis]|nr:hypothetical protein C8R47DRAFT_1066014 [Mycena vitilis]